MEELWGVPGSTAPAVSIIAVLTVLFVLSALSGVHRGIQRLSNGNMILAAVLLLFVFVVGPTVFILESQTEALGGCLAAARRRRRRQGRGRAGAGPGGEAGPRCGAGRRPGGVHPAVRACPSARRAAPSPGRRTGRSSRSGTGTRR
ncbi:BCCT family transporter [Streptomyces collinus]|uniref:BCCT family transporter n=1 Tax=Streptomyces collinus TaxID=42684 RepID=UPI0033E6539D